MNVISVLASDARSQNTTNRRNTGSFVTGMNKAHMIVGCLWVYIHFYLTMCGPDSLALAGTVSSVYKFPFIHMEGESPWYTQLENAIVYFYCLGY